MDEYVISDRASRQERIINQRLLEEKNVCVKGTSVADDLVHLGLIGLNVNSVIRRDQGKLFDVLSLDVNELNYFQEQKKEGSHDIMISSGNTYDVNNNHIIIPCDDSYFAGVRAGRGLQGLVSLVENKKCSLEEDSLTGVVTNSDSKALIIGAGGTGTYTALSALLAGYDVCVVDQDSIETSNLNRQVLYGGRQGENKAEVLSERLSPLGNISQVTGIIQEQKGLLEQYKNGLVFSCVDNAAARIYLDEKREEVGYTLIDTGTGPSNGRVHVAYDKSLQDQVVLIPSAKTSCVSAAPSVVMPNMVVGSLAVHQALIQSQDSLLYKGRENKVIL